MVNSISSTQPVQQTQADKRSDIKAARKQSDIEESNKVKDKKDNSDRQAQLQKAQSEKSQELSRPSVNTSGQKVGTLINTSA